ncbi:hypothetical protein HMN09_00349100 [Mycena chlorophos]|uniref:DUF6534 domain-containing protein n=1 Tax=Mycena chlorophos TaxID=658473 RepID=A0A8H6WN37_MYCCL|nr:hypothetical protein HMN09_00349100 [Mycena chlorophos]
MSSSNSTTPDSSATDSSSAASFDFAELLSAQLIGSLCDFMLGGAFLVQLVIYRICFSKDSRVFQILVYGLALLQIARICLVGYETQDLYAAGYGNFEILATEPQRQHSLIFGPIIICIVQHFFSYRSFFFDRRCWPICILISILSLAQCSVGLAWFALFFRGPDPLDDELNIIDDLGRAWYAGGMTTAVINTLTTAFILLRFHAVNQSTQQAVRRIVRFTIESNAVSAALEVVSLALLQAFPDDPYYVGTSYLLPGVYSNMVLVTLNYRVLIRQRRATSQTSTFPRAPVDLEKSRPNTQAAPVGPGRERESTTIGAGSVGPAEGGSVRTRISDETTPASHHHGAHLKIADVQIRVEEERSVSTTLPALCRQQFMFKFSHYWHFWLQNLCSYAVQPLNECILLQAPWLKTSSSFGPDAGANCFAYASGNCDDGDAQRSFEFPGDDTGGIATTDDQVRPSSSSVLPRVSSIAHR